MVKFPSIEQFRHVIKQVRLRHDYKGKDENGDSVYLNDSPYPILKFLGTVKAHGTNAGIVKYKDKIEFQSRERVLNFQQDNAGFYTKMSTKNLDFIFDRFEFNDYIAVFGEWCCGNIQKGVALSLLPEKKFIIFKVMVDGEWINLPSDLKDESQDIYNILDFQTFEVEIDFNNPEAIQNLLVEWTNKVEDECPIGRYFGVSGIGEGIVFTCESNPVVTFKSKGTRHSSSNVKTLNSIDTEKLESINSFIEYAVTENRLNQGLENITSIDIKYIGDYLRWVTNDVIKEEEDTLKDNGLEFKQVAKQISNKARIFFLSKL